MRLKALNELQIGDRIFLKNKSEDLVGYLVGYEMTSMQGEILKLCPGEYPYNEKKCPVENINWEKTLKYKKAVS